MTIETLDARTLNLGVCYYPEHWPAAWWPEDAAQMREMGISVVRIAEFAWSRLEPEPGQYDWSWLDEALDVLHRAGLRVVMCTPTATPPKWLVDNIPGMLAVDVEGRPRGFGSRRHYCFSNLDYRRECARITEAMAVRYGNHPAVIAWQTDNEYGCHDTTLSYSESALQSFRLWLEARYQTIEALNAAWGTIFWSQTYRSFEEIEAPNLTVTEANPSHRLDYWRHASEAVVTFNRLQVDVLRKHSPGRDIVHNFMGFYTEFDHFAVARDLDVATWDSYPLGFLEQFWFSEEEKQRYLRQGHPDIAAFHHDLYRGCGRGRWWVMEQQPGPVNWAAYNPAPLPGMVRAWTWQAFAHGAELVSYFRWRQAPFAQEQMHAGLQRPDRTEDHGAAEARTVAREIANLGPVCARAPAPVALVFDYPGDWVTSIQPQGRGFRALQEAFDWYASLRQAGLDVDIVHAQADFSGRRLIVVPCAPILSRETVAAIRDSGAIAVFGARTGSKTDSLGIPQGLPPGALADLIPMQVLRVESLRPGIGAEVFTAQGDYPASTWREDVCTEAQVIGRFSSGGGAAWLRHDRYDYVATCPGATLRSMIVEDAARRAGLSITALPEGLRLSRRGDLMFAINYLDEPQTLPSPNGLDFVIGGPTLPPAGVAIWRTGPTDAASP